MAKNELAEVLLDFGRTPGRYALRLREPAELHAQIDTLALWALGRVPKALQGQAQAIKAAAVMFLQRACFAPENNHYQILGLPQGPVDPELLRTRYRALIRLTHPDMGVEGLPANAAGLVNRAQKVLADPALRERYDHELENEAWPRWRAAPPVASAAVVPVARKPEAHWAQPKRRLNLGEDWSGLWARYPLQARLLMTATGVGALVVALLAWAANDTPGGAMLVVARTPAAAVKDEATRLATEQTAERDKSARLASAATSSAPQTVAATNRNTDDGAALQLSRDTPSAWPDVRPWPIEETRPGGGPRRDAGERVDARGRSQTNPPGQTAAALPPPSSLSAPPPPKPKSAGSNPSPVPAQVTAQDRAVRTDATSAARADHGNASTAPAAPPTDIRPMPGHAAPQAPAPVSAAVAQAQAPTPAPAPAPAAAPAQWTVDAPGATQYIRDLMATLERPQDAQHAQNLLRKMDVKGNLLAPGLRLGREYPQLKVTSLTLSPSPRPSALELRGTVLLTASNPQTAASTTVRYRLAAHFVGMPEGTAMSRLELVETE